MRGVLPYVTVQVYSTNRKHIYTYKRCVGRKFDVETVLVGTTAVRGTKDASGETIFRKRIQCCVDETLNRIIEEDVKIRNDSSNNSYN